MTKLVFFGSSEFSVIILKKLLSLPDFEISLVVTKADKAVGRHQTITKNAVAQFAVDHSLPLLQIEDFSPKTKSKILSFSPPCQEGVAADQGGFDLGLCVAFGPPFFDQELINLFPHKIVNIHPSPLPKYRGATPGPWQIINDEKTSSVTFFEIDLLPDHGPIIAQIPFKIDSTDTSQTFYHRAFSLAANHLDTVLKKYLQDGITTPQDHTLKSYHPKFTKNNAKINWEWTDYKISSFIRAMNPWPIAWTLVTQNDGRELIMKIFSADIINDKLQLRNVQIEGKKPTFWSEISTYYFIKK